MNKVFKIVVSLVLTFYAFSIGASSATAFGEGGKKPSVVFQDIEPVLLRQSQVPPILPSFLPYVDRQDPVYAISQSITKSSYEVLLVVELPCKGEHRCLYGSVRGSVAPFDHSFNGFTPKNFEVSLAKGIKGRFFEADCGAYCDEAYVDWYQNGYYYSIGLKAGEQKQMIEMANSAIALGNKH